MTTLAAPTGNEIQNTLAASYTRGTDTTITLTDGAAFPNSAHVVLIRDGAVGKAATKWCLVIYTSKATHVLTMGGGATDYALAKNVSIGDEAYEFPIGCVVELVCTADVISQEMNLAIHIAGASEILGITQDTAPIGTHELLSENAAGAKKAIPLENLAYGNPPIGQAGDPSWKGRSYQGWEVFDASKAVPFDGGTDEFVAGETVTADSAGTGIVRSWTVTSGSWAGNDAAGFLYLAAVSGTFADDDDLTGTSGFAVQNGDTSGVIYTLGAGLDFETLAAAAAAITGLILVKSITIQLSANITLTSDVTFSGLISAGGTLILDLNGYTLSIDDGCVGGIYARGPFTFEVTTETGTGVIAMIASSINPPYYMLNAYDGCLLKTTTITLDANSKAFIACIRTFSAKARLYGCTYTDGASLIKGFLYATEISHVGAITTDPTSYDVDRGSIFVDVSGTVNA